jgi:glycosyltransferase involved in cell wall biosynthesis
MEQVTVIIPTLARSARMAELWRAIESVLTQEGVAARPLIVVNGASRDIGLVHALAADSRVSLVSLSEASLPGAIRAGRAQVDSPFFTILDDDDVLLPGALALRIDTLRQRPDIDTVVTNGFLRSADGDTIHIANHQAVQEDPLRALLNINWLLPGSWLSRTRAVPPEWLEDLPPYLECMYLATRFASAGRMLFLETPTIAFSRDTPGSLSKSEAYALGEVPGLEAIRRLPLPGWYRRGIDRKMTASLHSLSERARMSGRYSEAWRWHLRSLLGRGGLRHLGFTRYLVAGPIAR